jgi:protein-L-isoaspartate(D-aspartate) O-methyltransferase
VPEALFAQLANKGRLIVPVGPEGAQQLIRFTRNGDSIDREVLGAVAFVPMLGGTA